MHELLAPNRLDITAAFNSEFTGMAATPLSVKELVDARERLITDVLATITDAGARFLLSLAYQKHITCLLRVIKMRECGRNKCQVKIRSSPQISP